MEIFAAMGVIILSALVHATLQLGLGTMVLLYHASSGKHISKKTKQLAGSFAAGAGTIVLLSVATLSFIIANWFGGALFAIELLIVIGMLGALALAAWFFYYRRSKSTELWIPRKFARFIDQRAKATNNDTEAFSLGLLTSFAEFPFTLVLMTISANSILALPENLRLLALAFYVIVAILPLIITRICIKNGKTAVEIQRWRFKQKNFFRILTGSGFLILGLFILAFEVLL